MADNYIQPGAILTTNNDSGGALEAGDPILCGNTLRVYINDCASLADGPAYSEGAFTLAATAADAWDDGAILYWNAGTSAITDTAGANQAVGIAVGDKAALATTCVMKLWPFLV